jgi:hypothetical protein
VVTAVRTRQSSAPRYRTFLGSSFILLLFLESVLVSGYFFFGVEFWKFDRGAPSGGGVLFTVGGWELRNFNVK